MLKNSEIVEKYGIPQRTLADWYANPDNWRFNLYKCMQKSDLVKIWEIKNGEFKEEDDFTYSDLEASLKTELAFLEDIDLTQNIPGIKKDFEDKCGSEYTIEEVQFLVALKNLGF